jgi:hypothetical protein
MSASNHYPDYFSGQEICQAMGAVAAGADMPWTLPYPGRYQLLGFTIQLNCSAVAANRQLAVRRDFHGTWTPQLLAGRFTLANAVMGFNGVRGCGVSPTLGSSARELFHIPECWIMEYPGSIDFQVLNMDAGDQLANGLISVRWWPI